MFGFGTRKTARKTTPKPAMRLGVEGLEDRSMPVADLTVGAFTAPTVLAPGDSLTTQFTVLNKGNAAAAGSWTDAILLSDDGDLSLGDAKLAEITHVGGLALNGSYTAAGTGTIPAGFGLRHVIVQTDRADAVAEPDPGLANSLAVPVAVVPGFAAGFVRAVVDPLQKVFGPTLDAQPLRVTSVAPTASAVTVTLQKNPAVNLSLAGFAVTDITVTVTGTTAGASAAGTVRLAAKAGEGTTEIVATLAVGTDGELTVKGSATATEVRIGTSTGLFLKSPTLTADVAVDLKATPLTVAGGVTVTAATAVVFTAAPAAGDPTGPARVDTFSAALTSAGKLDGTAKNLTVTTGPELTVTAAQVKVAYDPAATSGLLLSVGTATAKAVVFGKDVSLTVTDLKVTKDGKVSAATLTTDAAKALPKVRVAEVLPFTITSVAVLGIDNQAARLDRFDLKVDGTFDFSVFNGLPVTPIVSIGTKNVSAGADAFSFTLRNAAGTIWLQETGAIKLGFSDLRYPPLTLGATIALAGFKDGAFDTSKVGATFDLKADTTAVDLAGKAGVTGGITTAANGNVTLDLTGTITADFALSNGSLTVDDAALKFRLAWTVNPAAGRVGTPALTLDGLSATGLAVKVGDLLTFQSQGAAFDFKSGADKPFVTFGQAGVVFNDASGVLSGWGGTASNFGVGLDGKLFLLNGAKVAVTVPPGFKFGLPDWLPVSLTKVGLLFPGTSGGAVGGTGLTLSAPKKLSDAAGFGLVVSGGLEANATFPVTAKLDNLEVHFGDLVRILKGEAYVPFPIRNLAGVDVGVTEFELGKGFKVGGRLSFGTAAVGTSSILYARVKGGFKFQDVGADVDLILSSVGPVLATVSAPLAVPLGPSGLVLSGVSGGILFGSTIPTVADPRDLVGSKTDPRYGNPLDQASKHPKGIDGFIADRLAAAVTAGTPTFNTAFTLVLAGTFTHVASAGVATARATLAANINPRSSTAAPAGLKLLGFGDVYAQGLPLGDAKMILDFADPLAPKMAVAFQTPTPGSPLGFLLPASGTMVASFDTKGLAIGTAVGVRTFVQKVTAGTAGAASGFFGGVLDRVADRLAAAPTRPLAKFVLDKDGNGAVSAAELALKNDPVAFRAALRSRLLELLPADFAALNGTTFQAKLTKAAAVAQAAVGELFDAIAAAQKAATTPQSFDTYLAGFADGLKVMAGEAGQAVLAFADVVKDAVAAAARDAAAQFDPVLVISGKLQPTLLGIPFGPSKNSVDLRISKTGLYFGTDFSLGNFMTALATNGLSQALNVPSPVSDNLRVDVQFPFTNVFADLARGKLPTLDPMGGGWLVGIAGAVDVLGHRVGPVSGLLFPKNNPDLLLQRVQVADTNNDGQRDGTLDPAKIQVADKTTFDKLVASGGLLVDGILTVPKLLADPAAVAKLVGSSLPDPQADPAGFFNKLLAVPAALGQFDTLAQVQTFLPMPGGKAADAYLTGRVTGKVLSVSLANGTVSATKDKLIVTGEYLGATARLTVDKSATGLPRAIAEVNVGTSTLVKVFEGLGLPAGFLAAPAAGADAKLRLVSPGFDLSSPDILKRSGGAELTATLNVPGVAENANFLFRMTPPSAGNSLPDFKARATVDTLSIPGLSQAGLLTLRDFTVDLTKTGGTIRLRLNGTADLLGNALKADGTFTLTAGGLVGGFELESATGGAVPALTKSGFTLAGRVFLVVNTTSAARTVTVNGRDVSVPKQSGLLQADGSVTAAGFKLAGRFDLVAGTSGLRATADAVLDLGQFGKYDVDGAFTLRPTGLVADLAIEAAGGQGANFSLDGTFTLKLNTTGAAVGSVPAGASVSVAGGRLTLNGLGSTFRLTGSMTVGVVNGVFVLSVPKSDPLTASLWGGAVAVEFFGTVKSNGAVDLTATGRLRAEKLGWTFNSALTVRVTGSTTGGLSYSAKADGGVSFLGFELFDIQVRVSASGEVTATAKYRWFDPLYVNPDWSLGKWKTESVRVSFDL